MDYGGISNRMAVIPNYQTFIHLYFPIDYLWTMSLTYTKFVATIEGNHIVLMCEQ